METAIIVIILMGCVGLIFGLVLAVANKKFATEVNPLIELVEDVLPKGQCGACGFAGCNAYAQAVVLDESVAPNLCIPGKEEVAQKVSELTGKEATKIDPRYAHLRCSGVAGINAMRKYKYDGIHDCFAAKLMLGGSKSCEYGCLGLGTCVRNCPFDAITMGEDNLPIIDKDKCTGCGKCKDNCPKRVLEMQPVDAMVQVNCNCNEKGAIARKSCSVACIGCGLCVNNCPYDAITMDRNLAMVDSKICIEKCSERTCLAKCPTKAIRTAVEEDSYSEGSKVKELV